jgi:AAA+ superfamily predicted ATPase
MNNLDKQYIVEGITIDKTKEGYRVFTIPTQHFTVADLDELTNERFEYEIKRQQKYEKDSSELMRLYLSENE